MFHSIKLSALAVLALFLTACVSTPELTSDQISNIEVEVADYGLYELGKLNEVGDKDYIAGSSLEAESLIHTKTIDSLDAQVGVTFGVNFNISGLPTEKKMTFREVMIFPEMTDPQTGGKQSYYEPTAKYKNKLTKFKGFTFEYDWELVKGEWIYQIYYQDTLLAEQSFMVN